MEGKGSFFVLLIVVTVLSVCLAGVVGYLLVFGVQKPPSENANAVVQTQHVKPKIDYKKVQKFRPFKEEAQTIALMKSDDGKIPHAIRLKAELLIFDVKCLEEVTIREAEVKDYMISFFNHQKYEDVDNVANRDKLKEELLKGLNSKFPPEKGEKMKEKIVEISFDDWFVQ